MAELTDETVRADQEARSITALRRLRCAEVEGPLYWSLLPELALKVTEGREHRSTSLVRQAPRSTVLAAVRRTGPTLIRVGTVLFASTSIQHDRVLGPIIDSAAQSLGTQRVDHLPRLLPGGLRHAMSSASKLTLRMSTSLRPNTRGFVDLIAQTAVLLQRARKLFSSTNCPQVLVIGTQHGAAIRALVRAAHEAGRTRIVYLPHAPLARNPWYHDLPVHWALLRGPAEEIVYRQLGVVEGRVCSVGDPSVRASGRHRCVSEGTQVLYAVSVDDARSLSADISVIAEAGCQGVDVSMHPRLRNRSDLMRLLPREWTINPLPSTYERMLTSGPAAVIQHSSGVGLEALSLGLPLVDLCNPGRLPNYHYLSGPEVNVVSSSAGLSAVLRSVQTDERSAERRRAYAADWISSVGDDAADGAVLRLLEILERPVPDDLLLDGWASDHGGYRCDAEHA